MHCSEIFQDTPTQDLENPNGSSMTSPAIGSGEWTRKIAWFIPCKAMSFGCFPAAITMIHIADGPAAYSSPEVMAFFIPSVVV